MSTNQHIHSRKQEQGARTHRHAGGHSHFGHAQDGGSRLMGVLTLLSHAVHIEGSFSDYRASRLVPASNKMIIGTILVLTAGVVTWHFLPTGISTVPLVIVIAAAAHLVILVIGGLALTLFIRHIRSQARQSVLGTIPWQGSEKVLDVACGTGRFFQYHGQVATFKKPSSSHRCHSREA